MKKLMILTVAIFAVSTMPVLAEGGKKGERGGMFGTHDTNGDGVISKSEFIGHAEERFSKMDMDGSGDVTPEEAKEARQAMRKERDAKHAERKAKRAEREGNKGEGKRSAE